MPASEWELDNKEDYANWEAVEEASTSTLAVGTAASSQLKHRFSAREVRPQHRSGLCVFSAHGTWLLG